MARYRRSTHGRRGSTPSMRRPFTSASTRDTRLEASAPFAGALPSQKLSPLIGDLEFNDQRYYRVDEQAYVVPPESPRTLRRVEIIRNDQAVKTYAPDSRAMEADFSDRVLADSWYCLRAESLRRLCLQQSGVRQADRGTARRLALERGQDPSRETQPGEERLERRIGGRRKSSFSPARQERCPDDGRKTSCRARSTRRPASAKSRCLRRQKRWKSPGRPTKLAVVDCLRRQGYTRKCRLCFPLTPHLPAQLSEQLMRPCIACVRVVILWALGTSIGQGALVEGRVYVDANQNARWDEG